MKLKKFALFGLCCVLAASIAAAEPFEVNYEGGIIGNAGSGEFAPTYMAANRHGVLTQKSDLLLYAGLNHKMDTTRRFSYGTGVKLFGGYTATAPYKQFTGSELEIHKVHPANFWIQELYAEVKYRGVFLSAGLKERTPLLIDFDLSSGALTESGNSRPVPQVRAGFVNFQNIPFTNGWVQIEGAIAYGKFTDNAWMRDHYNYYYGHINQGALYTYKRCFLRSKPSMPFMVTVGMQSSGAFGGSSDWYYLGHKVKSESYSSSAKQFFKMFLPLNEGQSYYSGSFLGSWDIQLRYRFRNDWTVKGYLMKPFEDGSGIGFLNGFDGVWGLELDAPGFKYIQGAVVEYIDFTNQSGPSHHDPDDHAGSNLHHRAEGADNYYNNHEYNPYAYYGMSMGTPFLIAPIYNLNGTMEYLHNRARGFHIGVKGEIVDNLSYRALFGHQKSFGAAYMPIIKPLTNFSMMIEGKYRLNSVPGLDVKAQFAIDNGNLVGNNTGFCVSVSYNGNFNIGKK